jgi:predicted  nucleic acid-binding Zn-ribbon protein
MSDKPENLVLEHLRAMRGDLSSLKDGQKLTNERLAAIEHHMAGFHVTVFSHTDELESLKQRMDRIEKRLELKD